MDEYQEVFGVPAETAQDAPGGEGENEREDAGPAPGEGERDQEPAAPGAEEQQEEPASGAAGTEDGADADRHSGAEERHRQAQLLRQYMHNTEIAVTMRLSTILKTIKQPL